MQMSMYKSMQRILSPAAVITVFCLLATGTAPAADKQDTERKAGELLELELKGVKWKFHWCPSGSFLMSSPESETNRCSDETQHKVTLTQGFYMAETECTQEQWEAVTGNNPSHFKGAKLPVEQVSWDDCQKFITKLNALKVAPAGFKFSLPSEAQWEYACRAGSKTAYCFGDDWKELEKYAWYSGHKDYDEWKNSKEYKNNTFSKTAHEVGTKKPNAWGLHDMHGSVWEWCEDWYGDYNGDATDPVGASSGRDRVIRGGSWPFYAENCLSAIRSDITPEYRSDDLGLRVSLVQSGK